MLEFVFGSHPLKADSNDNGLSDHEELLKGQDPTTSMLFSGDVSKAAALLLQGPDAKGNIGEFTVRSAYMHRALEIPSAATVMEFSYRISGEPTGDYFTVFADDELLFRALPVPEDAGRKAAVDIDRFAGRTVRLYFIMNSFGRAGGQFSVRDLAFLGPSTEGLVPPTSPQGTPARTSILTNEEGYHCGSYHLSEDGKAVNKTQGEKVTACLKESFQACREAYGAVIIATPPSEWAMSYEIRKVEDGTCGVIVSSKGSPDEQSQFHRTAICKALDIPEGAATPMVQDCREVRRGCVAMSSGRARGDRQRPWVDVREEDVISF